MFSFDQSVLRWVFSRCRHRVRSPCGWAVPVASAITRWDCPFIPVLLIHVLLKHLIWSSSDCVLIVLFKPNVHHAPCQRVDVVVIVALARRRWPLCVRVSFFRTQRMRCGFFGLVYVLITLRS